MDPHVAFHFTQGVGGRIKVEEHIVTLPVFLDPVGQGP